MACEQQTHFRSSLLSLQEREKRRPEMRLLFAGYLSNSLFTVLFAYIVLFIHFWLVLWLEISVEVDAERITTL